MYTPLLHSIKDKILKNEIYTLAFIGDSLTSAEWIHPNWREIVEYVLKSELEIAIATDIGNGLLKLYFDQFHGQHLPGDNIHDYIRRISSWNIRTINLARDGSTTKDWIMNADRWIGNKDINLAIVMGTVNDADFNVSTQETINNYKGILEYLENKNITTVITTTSRRISLDNQEKVSALHNEIYNAFNTHQHFVDIWGYMGKLSDEEINSFFTLLAYTGEIDREHPNVLGNAFIAAIYLHELFGIQFDYKKYYNNILAMTHIFPEY